MRFVGEGPGAPQEGGLIGIRAAGTARFARKCRLLYRTGIYMQIDLAGGFDPGSATRVSPAVTSSCNGLCYDVTALWTQAVRGSTFPALAVKQLF